MDIAGIAAYSTIQPLQSVKNEVGVNILKKSMQFDTQAIAGIMDGMFDAATKAMELSVNPNVGSMFDART